MNSSQMIAIVDRESRMIEVQVNAGLRWAERYKRPVTAVLMEPITPVDEAVVSRARESLECLLNAESVQRRPVIVYEDSKILLMLKCSLSPACDIIEKYKDQMKQNGILLACYPQMHEPYIEPPKPEPEPKGICARIAEYAVNLVSTKKDCAKAVPVNKQFMFYDSLVLGFETEKHGFSKPLKQAPVKKRYVAQTAEPALCPAT